MSTSRLPVIDVHSHFVPHAFPASPSADAGLAWPRMEGDDVRRTIYFGDRRFRELDAACWDMDLRLEHMEHLGVTHQVLSPMPELMSYWLPTSVAARLLKFVNQQLATFVHGRPDRFFGLGIVSLQDVDQAVRDLRYCVEDLRLSGVQIGSNINGDPLGCERLRPFFRAAQECGAAVFVHPIRPAGMERLPGPRMLGAVAGFPCETALAIASVLTTGLLAECPALRLGFSHGGGAIASLLPRLQHAYHTFPAMRELMSTDPIAQARRLYYDGMLFDDRATRYLCELVGYDRVMIGTDSPFDIQDVTAAGRIGDWAEPCHHEALLAGNALSFLSPSSYLEAHA